MFENDLKILKAMLLMYDTMRIANRDQLKEEILLDQVYQGNLKSKRAEILDLLADDKPNNDK